MIKTTVEIKGMRCGMCEAHMNDTIRHNFDVESVKSSYKKGISEIVSKNELDGDKIKKVIEETGYDVINVSSETYVKKGLFSFGK